MNLLLLTKFYPYGTGEAFLENEIEILSEYYDKILIIACEISEEIAKTKRYLPKNVESSYVPTVNKYKLLALGLKRFFSKEKEIEEERKETNNLMQKIFLCYFEEKSQKIFEYIIKNKLINHIISNKYIIYSYWLFTTARVGILIKHLHKPIYCFSRAHRYDLYEEENRIKYLPYRKLFLKEYDNIFPCSENGSLYLKNKYNILANKVKTSYLGTIDHGINPKDTDNFFHIISCSRVDPVKRVYKIVEALEILDKQNILLEWTHIGEGSELSKIKAMCQSKIKNIKYNFRGNMQNSEVIKLYKEKHFDIFINVSSSEGLPVSIMEAISFGIPVIATDVGGTSEIIVNGLTGHLIEKNFSASKLSYIIAHYTTKDLTNLRSSCRNFWNSKYRAEIQYKKLNDTIDKNIKYIIKQNV